MIWIKGDKILLMSTPCQMPYRRSIWTFVNSNLIRKPTVVAHKEFCLAAWPVSPFARGIKNVHTVVFPIKTIGLISIPASKLCLSFTVEAAVTQGPSPAVHQVIIETDPSLACSKRFSFYETTAIYSIVRNNLKHKLFY